MQLKLSHFIFVGVTTLYLVLFFLIGNGVDGDNNTKDLFNGSAFILFLGSFTRLGLTFALPFVYAVFIAWCLTRHIVRREWERVVFFASPFTLANMEDVFSRVVFCMACAQIVDVALKSRRPVVATTGTVMLATTHPFNAVFAVLTLAPLLSPVLLLLFWGLDDLRYLDVLGPVFADKTALLRTYGLNLASTYQGQYAIRPDMREAFFGAGSWLAIVFPGLGVNVQPLIAYGLAAYHAVWIGLIFWLTPYRRNVILTVLPMSIIVAVFVGNSAVGYRHLLPILYSALVIFGRTPPKARGVLLGLVGFRFGLPNAAAVRGGK
jgi:hypothetical protein